VGLGGWGLGVGPPPQPPNPQSPIPNPQYFNFMLFYKNILRKNNN